MFSDKIKALMMEKGLTQIDISEILKIRQSQVSNWLNGKSLPGYKSIKTICECFKLSADYLLDIGK